MSASLTQRTVADFKEKYTDLICEARSKAPEECLGTMQSVLASVVENVPNESVLEQIVLLVFESGSVSGKDV